jgi:hypothetical protein
LKKIDLNQNVYEPADRMAAFRVKSRERLIHWIHCLVFRYHVELGEKDEFLVEWIDKLSKHNGNKHDEIQIKILRNDDNGQKIITIHVFLTTFLITVQGTFYKEWVSSEFEYLKTVVEVNTPSSPQSKSDINKTATEKNGSPEQTSWLSPSVCDEAVLKESFYPQQSASTPSIDQPTSELNEILSTPMGCKNKATPRLLLPKPIADINGTKTEQTAFIQNIESNLCSVLKSFEEKLDNLTQTVSVLESHVMSLVDQQSKNTNLKETVAECIRWKDGEISD